MDSQELYDYFRYVSLAGAVSQLTLLKAPFTAASLKMTSTITS
jgi:hypothetical protein